MEDLTGALVVVLALAVVFGAVFGATADFATVFFAGLSLTPASLAVFDRALLRRAAVCLLMTFFLVAVSIAL